MRVKAIIHKIFSTILEMMRIIFILAVCAAIGFFIAVGERAGSPERYAEKYFSNYLTNNYSEMYKMADISKSKMFDEKTFAHMCAGNKVYGTLLDYQFGSAVVDGDNVTFVVSYRLEGVSETQTFTITLKKQSKKKYLFFDTWKVSIDRYMVKDFEFRIPENMTASIDGIDLTGYEKENGEEGAEGAGKVYVVPAMFTGDHTLSLKQNGVELMSQSLYIDSTDTEYEVTTDSFELNSNEEKDMIHASELTLVTLYRFAMDGWSESNRIASFFASDESSQAKAKNVFDQLKASIVKENGTTLRSLSIESMNSKVNSFTYQDSVEIQIDYNYKFSANSGVDILNPYSVKYSGEGWQSAIFTFSMVDGAWKLTDAAVPCANYYKQN